MTASSIVMMIVGIVVIWGGLAASIANAVSKAKQNKIIQKTSHLPMSLRK